MMNEKDRKLHEEIHKKMMGIDPRNIFSSRVNLFNKIAKKLGVKQIEGKVLDIGCGSGYASIWLAKNMNPEIVYAVEASEAAITELLPRNIKYYGLVDKVIPTLASFDALPFTNEIDYVISFGALHHSQCLLSTMQSVSKSLKNGGYLIAQEPVMPNMTSNQDFIDKYNIVENRFGIKMTNGERNDRFFREAEYIAAAAFSGLDLILYQNFTEKNFISTCKEKIFNILRSNGIIKDPRMHVYQKLLMKKVMVFRKNQTDYIPHLWNGLMEKK